jgi:hypothetical protein
MITDAAMSEPTAIAEYMNEAEEVSYSLSHRPTGALNWIKSRLGFGMTHWYVTN